MVEEHHETPTRDDLPTRSRLPEVAPIQDTPTVAAPISTLLTTPKVLPDVSPPPSSRPPVSKPPPLPSDSGGVTKGAAPVPARPESAPRRPASTGTAPRAAKPLPAGARYARFFALAVAAAIATVWIGSRARRAQQTVPAEQTVAVGAALDQALDQAKTCAPDATPPARTELTVTFAPTGKVTSAEIGGESMTEPVRACVLSHVRGLEIPAFEGTPIEVRREIALGR